MMRRALAALSVLAVAAGLLFSVPAAAQGNGATLEVVARDPNGAAVAGARVSVTAVSDETAAPHEAKTDRSGHARVNRLARGPYTVRVEAPGFAPYVREAFVPEPGANRLDVHLEVARVDEELVVAEDPVERRTDPR